jgi:hypothetical protein
VSTVRAAVRRHGLSAAKAAVAAAVAWQVSRALLPAGPGFYAPLVAALSVHPTVARTLRDGGQRLLAVGIGLLLGYVVVRLGGVHWWSMFGVTALATLLAAWHRLGGEGVQVVVAALLMLLFAEHPADYATGLLAEGVIGALVAAVVNVVLVPPVHVRSAEQALTELRLAVGGVAEDMSRDVGAEDWPPSSPGWLDATRRLERPLSRAREAVDQGSESIRLNPRARRLRTVPQRQRQALTALEYIVVDLRQMARTLSEASDETSPSFVLADVFRPRFADALHAVAGALTAYGDEQAPSDAAAAQQPVEAARSHVEDLQRSVTEAEHHQVASLIAESALAADLEQVVSSLERGPLHRVGS